MFSEALPTLLEAGHEELLAYSLSGVAVLAVRQQQLSRAAQLEAAASNLRESHGLVVWPVREALYADTQKALRQRLGDPAIERAWAEGSRMTAAEAVAYALSTGAAEVPSQAAVAVEGLSARETEVAALIAAGRTSREIAGELVISEKTADSHADHIRTKLGLRSRAEIAAWAVVNGIHTPQSAG